MSRSLKSLKATCQDLLARYLDVLTDVGCVPYYLLKPSLAVATPQQLYKIERANPDILKESDELWLRHCLTFKDIRDEYDQGEHQDPTQWRDLYMNRYADNERRKEQIKQKVRSQYNSIQNQREQKSIKVLRGVLPSNKRTYEAARQTSKSKLFQQTKKQAQKASSIYNSTVKRHAPGQMTGRLQPQQPHVIAPNKSVVPIIRAPKKSSALIQAYESFKYSQPPLRHHRIVKDDRTSSPPLIPPKSNVLPTFQKKVLPFERKTSMLTQNKNNGKRQPEEPPSEEHGHQGPPPKKPKI